MNPQEIIEARASEDIQKFHEHARKDYIKLLLYQIPRITNYSLFATGWERGELLKICQLMPTC
jgi:hypothetical protein